MKNQSIVARGPAQRRCSFRRGPAPKGLTAPDFRYFESPIGEARFASTRRVGLAVPGGEWFGETAETPMYHRCHGS